MSLLRLEFVCLYVGKISMLVFVYYFVRLVFWMQAYVV